MRRDDLLLDTFSAPFACAPDFLLKRQRVEGQDRWAVGLLAKLGCGVSTNQKAPAR